jgi:hypothetical protein
MRRPSAWSPRQGWTLRGVVGAAVATIGLLSLPGSGGLVALQYEGHASGASRLGWGGFAGGTVRATVGACTGTSTATVPTGSGAARANLTVTEPTTCPNRIRLVYAPALQFSNGLAVTAGHLLTVQLALTGVSGATTMLRYVRCYVQLASGSLAIVTATSAAVFRGSILTATTSTATLAALTAYGVGLSTQLVAPPTSSTAVLHLTVALTLDDGGVVRAVLQQAVTLTITY